MNFQERIQNTLKPSGVAWYASTTPQTSTGTPIQITFDNSVLVEGIALTSNAFVVSITGNYLITYTCNIDNDAATKVAVTFLKKNGADISGSAMSLSTKTGEQGLMSFSVILSLIANDAVSLWLTGQSNVFIKGTAAAYGGPISAGAVFSISKL